MGRIYKSEETKARESAHHFGKEGGNKRGCPAAAAQQREFYDGWRMLPPSVNYWHMWRMRVSQAQGANLLLPCSVVSGCKISLI